MSSPKTSLGPAEALAHLQKTGRKATNQWVDNHWSLILWKLAGLAVLDPKRETTPERRWCWRAVLDQLEKRYDKEVRFPDAFLRSSDLGITFMRLQQDGKRNIATNKLAHECPVIVLYRIHSKSNRTCLLHNPSREWCVMSG